MDRPLGPPPPFAEQLPSRSENKRSAHATRDLAPELIELTGKALATMLLEPYITEAVELGRRITKHGGRRRQLQLVAKYLRTIDTAPIVAALDRLRHQRDPCKIAGPCSGYTAQRAR